MRIKFLSQTALDTLRLNLNHYLPFFKEETNERLIDELRKTIQEEPLIDSNFSLPDNLILDPTHIGKSEIEEVKVVYGALKKLPRSIACDARFWSGLTIAHFWTFSKIRWHFEDKIAESSILGHFLFMGQSKKAYTRNAIARLWWIGDLTYDERRNDPYEVTPFVLDDTDYIVNLIERNFSNNKVIVNEFVEAVETARKNGLEINRLRFRSLCKYLNLLGGTYVLDALPTGEIRKKIYAKAEKLCRE